MYLKLRKNDKKRYKLCSGQDNLSLDEEQIGSNRFLFSVMHEDDAVCQSLPLHKQATGEACLIFYFVEAQGHLTKGICLNFTPI